MRFTRANPAFHHHRPKSVLAGYRPESPPSREFVEPASSQPDLPVDFQAGLALVCYAASVVTELDSRSALMSRKGG